MVDFCRPGHKCWNPLLWNSNSLFNFFDSWRWFHHHSPVRLSTTIKDFLVIVGKSCTDIVSCNVVQPPPIAVLLLVKHKMVQCIHPVIVAGNVALIITEVSDSNTSNLLLPPSTSHMQSTKEESKHVVTTAVTITLVFHLLILFPYLHYWVLSINIEVIGTH